MVDCYDVTIFPAESTKNTVSKKAKLKTARQELLDINNNYTACFTDLEGKINVLRDYLIYKYITTLKNNIIRAENFRMGYPSRAAEVHLNYQAGSTFPVLVCTEPPGRGQQSWFSTRSTGQAGATRLTRSDFKIL